VLFEILPGLQVSAVVLNKTGIVVVSIIDPDDILIASAIYDAGRYLKEGHIVGISAIINALWIASKELDSVLSNKSIVFSVDFLLFFQVCLD